MKSCVILLLVVGCGGTSFTAYTDSSEDAGAVDAAPGTDDGGDAGVSAGDARAAGGASAGGAPLATGGVPTGGGARAAGGTHATGGAMASGGALAAGGTAGAAQECKPGAIRCQSGTATQACDVSGTWEVPAECPPCVSPWMPCCMGSNGCACVSSLAVCR